MLERLTYGGIMLGFGLIPGALAGLLGLLVSNPLQFHLGVLLATGAFFFGVGFTLRDQAADFLTTGLHATVLALLAPGGAEAEQGAFSDRWSVMLLMAWIAMVAVLLLWF